MRPRPHAIQRPYLLVLSIAAILFVVGVAGKFHFSSLGMWSSYNQKSGPIAGLVAGEPQGVRSDEWLLGVPWLLSQLNSNPPLQDKNVSVGAETSALLVGLPTKHWSAVFRPAQWGFFFLNTERGFSWYWMTRAVACFAALTLFFLALTDGALALSVAGALWIYFSAFTQWWFASVSELLLYFSAACAALRLIFVTPRIPTALFGAAVFLLASGGFALTLYPPFQVPLFYLGVCLLPLLLRGVRPSRTPWFWSRVGTLAALCLTTVVVVALFLRDNVQAVALMENTVYPGRRLSAGGGLSWQSYFTGFFAPFWTANAFPRQMGNICEASSFILMWPLAVVSLWRGASKGFIYLIAPLIVYLALSAYWAYSGIPMWLAHASGWELVPPSRGIIGWGIGSVVLSILVTRFAERTRPGRGILVTLGCLGALVAYFLSQRELYVSTTALKDQTILAAGFLGLVISIVWRAPLVMLLSVLAVCVYPHGLVNPLMRGMRPILENPLVRAVSAFDESRVARWVVFDSSEQAQLVKATGRKVLNGSQYLPHLRLMKKIDPAGAQQEIYNRYAHGTFLILPPGSPHALFLATPDAWHLHIDPCGEKFAEMRVDYIVVTQPHPEHDFSCYERVFQEGAISIYRRGLQR